MEKIDVWREAEYATCYFRGPHSLDRDAAGRMKAEQFTAEWLRSLLARDRREMAERMRKEYGDYSCGCADWLLAAAEELEKP